MSESDNSLESCVFDELTGEKSTDSSECETSPTLKEFAKMPMDVIGEIVSHLNPFDLLNTRNVSYGLQITVDRFLRQTRKISFAIAPDGCSLTIGNNPENRINYSKGDNGFLVECEKNTRPKNGNYLRTAMNDLKFLMQNWKLKLKQLHFTAEDGFDFQTQEDVDKELNVLLNELMNSTFHTEEMKIFGFDEHVFANLLKCANPRVLKSIQAHIEWKNYDNKEIIETEQWRNAKRLTLFDRFPNVLHEISHFETIELDLNFRLIDLKEELMRSKNFKSGKVYRSKTWYESENIKEALESWRYPYNMERRSFPIPESKEFLKFNVTDDVIEIKKSS